LSSFHEFHEPIPVITPLGDGRAILIERTPHDYWWTVVLENGAVVTMMQSKIRVCRSYTHERGVSDEQMRDIIKEPTPACGPGCDPLDTAHVLNVAHTDALQPLKTFKRGGDDWRYSY